MTDQITNEQESEFETTHILSDIEVMTVGLVPKGANNLDFFLLKQQKGANGMPQDINIEEVVPEGAPDEVRGVVEQVKTGIANLFKAATPPEPEQPQDDQPLDKTEPEAEPDPEPVQAEVSDSNLEKLLKAQTDRFEALLKQQKAEMDAQVIRLETDLAKANERAQKAEQYADGQTERAERREMVQKALTYKAVPLDKNKLGDLLYRLNKGLDTDTYQEVETLLAAMDKQAWTAGLFKEMGSARTPEQLDLEDKVERIRKEQKISYEDALLSLSPEEQIRLMEDGA